VTVNISIKFLFRDRFRRVAVRIKIFRVKSNLFLTGKLNIKFREKSPLNLLL